MKSLTTVMLSAVMVTAFAASASAQDEDDMFSEDTSDDTTTDDGAVEDGSIDTDPAVEEPVAETTVAGGVARNAGNLGIGFSTTTSNLSGVEAEYWISPTLMATGIARINYLSSDNFSLTGLEFGAGAMLVLKDRGKAALLAGGRFLVGFSSFSPEGADSVSSTSIAIEVPLRLQMSLHPQVSAHLEGGMAINIGDQAGLGGDPDTSFAFGIGTNNLFGAAGMTFYFE